MKRVIVDASLAGAWLLPDEHSDVAAKVLGQILKGAYELSVPELWSYEIMNLLVSACRRRRITQEQVLEGQHLLQTIPCTSFEHSTPLARERVVGFALRFNLTAYDAAYLELADRLQCELHTTDSDLVRAARTLGLTVR